jgi:hypothetical protein
MTMTDETTTDDQVRNGSSAQEPPEDQVQATAPETSPEAPDDDGAQKERPANREARYRTERNEAREQVKTLEARVDTLLSRDVARIAAETLADGWDLLTFAPGVTDLLDEHGNPDYELITERAREVVAWKPGLARGVRVMPKGAAPGGFGQGNRPSVDSGTTTTWGSVLRGTL